MSEVGVLQAGNRHDLRVGASPHAPDEGDFRDDADGAFGYVHSYGHRRAMTDPACVRCCFSRAVCCDVPIAITLIPGI